jgi:hypothetical protein
MRAMNPSPLTHQDLQQSITSHSQDDQCESAIPLSNPPNVNLEVRTQEDLKPDYSPFNRQSRVEYTDLWIRV